MGRSVVGVYEHVKYAEEAAQELIDKGFDQRNVDISETSESSANRRPENKDKVRNFFDNLFGSNEREEARRYSEIAERGAVVTVNTFAEDDTQQALRILEHYERKDHGRKRIDDPRQQYQDREDVRDRKDENEKSYKDRDLNFSEQNDKGLEDVQRKDKDVDKTRKVPVIEENLQVGKEEYETEKIRLRTRIIEKPIEENLRLRTEKVYIERKPVNRPATEAEMNAFKEGTMEFTEKEEIPIIKKEAKVVEEINVRKDVEERDKKIRESVRKQDVDIEKKKPNRERADSDDVI